MLDFWVPQPSIHNWRTVFYVSAAVYGFSNLFYILFAQGTEQWWNSSTKENREVELKTVTVRPHSVRECRRQMAT